MPRTFQMALFAFLLVCFSGNVSVMAGDSVPLRVRMVLVKVHPLLEKGQYNQAIALLHTFQNEKDGPDDTVHDHAEINFALGNCHAQLGQLPKARNNYRHTIDRNPVHLAGWQNLAKVEYEQEDYTAASKAFYKSYQLTDKKDAALLYYSAVSLLMAGKYETCLHHFDALLADHPEKVSLEWKENIVYALLHADKPKRALSFMIELANGFNGKKQQQWQEILLQHYMALNMGKEAMALVHTLTRKAPVVAIWWRALAHIQLQNEHYDKALAALRIYSFLSPLTQEEEKLLGDLYMQQEIPQKAVINYENCTYRQKDQQTLISLVRAYLSLNRPELALERLKTLGAGIEEQKRAMLQGEIHYLMKDYKQAVKCYELAAKNTGKESKRGYLMAGYSYWQQGNLTSAQQSFREAAKSKRFQKEAERAIKQLAPLTETGKQQNIKL